MIVALFFRWKCSAKIRIKFPNLGPGDQSGLDQQSLPTPPGRLGPQTTWAPNARRLLALATGFSCTHVEPSGLSCSGQIKMISAPLDKWNTQPT